MMMKRITLFFLSFVLVCLVVLPGQANAAPAPASDPFTEPYSGEMLCLPGAYLYEPMDCLPYGPSQYITELAQNGIDYPLLPLNAARPQASLGELDYEIAKINIFPPERAPVYATLEDAVSGNNPVYSLQTSELLYVSFSSSAYINGGNYVYTASGGWMRASPASFMSFQGLIFDTPPNTSFGWIVEMTNPKTAPDYFAQEVDWMLPRERAVQIFDVVNNGALEYYMVGINQWVERRYIRELEIITTPPEGVDTDRWIEINLYQQTLSVYENNQLRFATLIASGVDPYFTRPGLFQIFEKKPTETMSGAFAADLSDYYYLEDVPWTMYYDEARAIHGAYWRAWLGYPQSHGCVNMSVADSRWVYDWAQVGDWVYVWDPSGQTPTDPDLYTPGGA